MICESYQETIWQNMYIYHISYIIKYLYKKNAPKNKYLVINYPRQPSPILFKWALLIFRLPGSHQSFIRIQRFPLLFHLRRLPAKPLQMPLPLSCQFKKTIVTYNIKSYRMLFHVPFHVQFTILSTIWTISYNHSLSKLIQVSHENAVETCLLPCRLFRFLLP